MLNSTLLLCMPFHQYQICEQNTQKHQICLEISNNGYSCIKSLLQQKRQTHVCQQKFPLKATTNGSPQYPQRNLSQTLTIRAKGHPSLPIMTMTCLQTTTCQHKKSNKRPDSVEITMSSQGYLSKKSTYLATTTEFFIM